MGKPRKRRRKNSLSKLVSHFAHKVEAGAIRSLSHAARAKIGLAVKSTSTHSSKAKRDHS